MCRRRLPGSSAVGGVVWRYVVGDVTTLDTWTTHIVCVHSAAVTFVDTGTYVGITYVTPIRVSL